MLLCVQLHYILTQMRNQNKQQNYSSENLIKFMKALQNVNAISILLSTDVNDAYSNLQCNCTKVFNNNIPVIISFEVKKI